MKKVTTTEGITDAYIKRILGNIIGVDPMSVLKATPKRLLKATKGLTKKEMQTPWAPGKWNMVQIVNHLCDAELALGYRFRKVIAEPGSPIQAYDENKWTANLHYEEAIRTPRLHSSTHSAPRTCGCFRSEPGRASALGTSRRTRPGIGRAHGTHACRTRHQPSPPA